MQFSRSVRSSDYHSFRTKGLAHLFVSDVLPSRASEVSRKKKASKTEGIPHSRMGTWKHIAAAYLPLSSIDVFGGRGATRVVT